MQANQQTDECLSAAGQNEPFWTIVVIVFLGPLYKYIGTQLVTAKTECKYVGTDLVKCMTCAHCEIRCCSVSLAKTAIVQLKVLIPDYQSSCAMRVDGFIAA